MANLNRDNSVFYGNTIKASKEIQSNGFRDYDGGNNPLNMGNNVTIHNYTPAASGNDGGTSQERYQLANDSAQGDVITDTPVETGTTQSHSGLSISEITLDVAANAANDYYNLYFINITSGLHIGQVREIIDYDGGTKVAMMQTAYTAVQITGTVSTTATSTTVTGVGTAFLTELAVGDSITIATETMEIASITNNLVLDVVNPYVYTNIGLTATLLNPSGGVTYDLFNKNYISSFWDESAKSWAIGFNTAIPTSTIAVNEYAKLTIGELTLMPAGGTPSSIGIWTAASNVVSGASISLNTFTGTSYMIIGNTVYLNINIDFAVAAPIAADSTETLTITGPPSPDLGVPPAASAIGTAGNSAQLINTASKNCGVTVTGYAAGNLTVELRFTDALVIDANSTLLTTLVYRTV